MQTPLELCLLWNKTRQRQVPEAVIVEFYGYLQEFPPQVSDGLVAIHSVPVTPEGIDCSGVGLKFMGV
ncbi:MAG TPA: hypothetical protein DC064_14050 [Cyanobacteria bacterium UBA9273]|nr:hypothetical protein [Cyanobacteria bacterium UBA9273]